MYGERIEICKGIYKIRDKFGFMDAWRLEINGNQLSNFFYEIIEVENYIFTRDTDDECLVIRKDTDEIYCKFEVKKSFNEYIAKRIDSDIYCLGEGVYFSEKNKDIFKPRINSQETKYHNEGYESLIIKDEFMFGKYILSSFDLPAIFCYDVWDRKTYEFICRINTNSSSTRVDRITQDYYLIEDDNEEYGMEGEVYSFGNTQYQIFSKHTVGKESIIYNEKRDIKDSNNELIAIDLYSDTIDGDKSIDRIMVRENRIISNFKDKETELKKSHIVFAQRRSFDFEWEDESLQGYCNYYYIRDKETYLFGLANGDYEIVIPCKYKDISIFTKEYVPLLGMEVGYAIAERDNDICIINDKLIETFHFTNIDDIIYRPYIDIHPFRKGKLWGYIKNNGEILITPRYKYAGAFGMPMSGKDTCATVSYETDRFDTDKEMFCINLDGSVNDKETDKLYEDVII